MKENNHKFNERGGIVVKNHLKSELPEISIVIKSGKTTYRFTGSYDGKRSITSKLLDNIERGEKI